MSSLGPIEFRTIRAEPRAIMFRNRVRGAIRRKIPGYDAGQKDLANAWAAQILSQRFVSKQNMTEALKELCDKPDGYYIFIRPDNMEQYKFAVLLRRQGKSVRYNILPSEDYSAYIMSTLDDGELRYNSISELVQQWDDSGDDYEMIRKMEQDEMSCGAKISGDMAASEGAQAVTLGQESLDEVHNVIGNVKQSDRTRPPKIYRNLKLQYYRNTAPGGKDEPSAMTVESKGPRTGYQSHGRVDDVYSLLGNVKLSDRSIRPSIHRSRKGRQPQHIAPQVDKEHVNLVQHDYEQVEGTNTDAGDESECYEVEYYQDDYYNGNRNTVNQVKVDFGAIGRIRRGTTFQ